MKEFIGYVVMQLVCAGDFACHFEPLTGQTFRTYTQCLWELDRQMSSGRYRDDELVCADVWRGAQ